MIFVIAGTERFPFDRLIIEIDSLKLRGILDDDVYIQLGSSTYRPKHCSWTQYLPFNEMVQKIQTAGLVIAHAGAGTALLCLHLGQRPLLVSRRKKFREHVDDHQVQLATKLKKLDWADVAYDVSDLQNIIEYRKSYNNVSFQRKANIALPRYLDEIIETWTSERRNKRARFET